MVDLVSVASVAMLVLDDDDDDCCCWNSSSMDFKARFKLLVNSPNCFRAARDVSLASSKDWAVASRWERRSVRLNLDQEVKADWRSDRQSL